MAGYTALGGPELIDSNHNGAVHQRSGGWRIPAGLEPAVDLPAALSLLSPSAPADGADAPAAGTPNRVLTTLTIVGPSAEDGAVAPADDAPDDHMMTATDAAPTADAVASPKRPGKYSVVDAEYIRRRRLRNRRWP